MLKEGTVFWFTGLAGAGKTTLAQQVYRMLKQKGYFVIFLDGDVLRETLDIKPHGHTYHERLQIAYRNARLCKLIADQGVHVVCATISLFHEVQEWNRAHQSNYQEIFIHVPMEMLRQRNQKGLYNSSENVVGVDIAPEFPKNPDITIDNTGAYSPETLAKIVLETVEESTAVS